VASGKWKSSLAVVSTAMVLAGVLAGCGSGGAANNETGNSGSSNGGQLSNKTASNTASGSAGQPVMGGTIQIDENQDFPHLDPALAYDNGDWEVVPEMYDQLVTYKPGTAQITPDAATSYDISSDGKTYTFHLHHNITFWNGTKVTAQNFIDEFQRILSKKVNSPGEGFLDPIVVGSTAYNSGSAKTISGITAPDPYTLVIHLTKPEPFFINVLAMPFFSAVDQSYINKIGNKQFDHQPMGTGPFMFKSYELGKEFIMVNNPNYFKPNTPKLNEVDIFINSNEQASALKFKQGTSAFISYNQNIDSQDFVSMMNDPQYKNDFYHQTLVSTWYIALNTKPKSPIQNKLVRQAINMAVDKQKLVKLLNGRATPANQILPPAMPGYNKNLPSNVNYQYNPTEAKKLLQQAGYSNGFTVDMLSPNDSTTEKLTQSIQADLAQIGITVKLHPEAGSSYLQDSENLKYPLDYTAWFQDFPDPYDFLDVLLNGDQIPANNWSNYNNPTVNKELGQAAVMPDGSARYALYQKIQNQVLADAPWVPLYTPVQFAVVQPWVKGFYMGPVLQDPFQDIWVTKH
jgi:ABC-type transport system substrate-binding protein